MKTAGYILLAILLLRLIISIINYLWKLKTNFFFRPIGVRPPFGKMGVRPRLSWSILVPVRNEEGNIGNLLGDIERLDVMPDEVIIFDDNSLDNTLKVVESFGDRLTNLKVIRSSSETLPEGWLGKNNACYQLANAAKGEYLLFLDADVRVGNGIEENYIRYAQKKSASLLSVFPLQILPGYQSKISTPIMNWILLSLLPLPLVEFSSFSSFAAANGQFMLFKADRYKVLQPHREFRNSKAEDIEICRYYKRKGEKTTTLTGDKSVRCLMYNNLEEAINGFSKNVFYFFGNSVALTIIFLLITTLTPLYLLIFNGLVYGLGSILAIIVIRIMTSATGEQSLIDNIRYLPQQHAIFIRIVMRALRNRREREQIWKGRNIY